MEGDSMSDVEMMHVDSLKPYKKNARTHPAAQIKKIVKSIEQFGFTNPVLTDGKGGIVAGHGRVMAAKEMGLKHVPTIPLSHLTKDQIRAYIIADNKLTLDGAWDEDVLKEELAAINLSDVDIELTGFDPDELTNFLDDPNAEPDPKDDEVPDTPQNVHNVQRGDIWQLGKHRIMCGDSTNGVDIVLLMDSQKADMVFTDPPYGMSYKSNWKNSVSDRKIKNDDAYQLGWITGSEKSGYAFCRFDSYAALEGGLKSKGLKIFTCLVWDKQSHTFGNLKSWANTHEFLVYFGTAKPTTTKRMQNVIRERRLDNGAVGAAAGDDMVHPTQKPLTVIQYVFDCEPIGSVYDPFLGSGSTLIACEKTGRSCYGMEIDPHYCSVIIERWQQFTGETAEKVDARET
jgi:DNA modification methylase